jgi:hypothetical protein
MNHHEFNRELKRMDLCEILIHLIHICRHVEQSKYLLFLSWLVWRGGTNSHSLPLENLKVTRGARRCLEEEEVVVVGTPGGDVRW